MTDDVAAVLERARERVTPNPEERAALDRVVSDLRERAERAVEDLPVEADVLLVGSVSRGTWLPGDRDVDVFVRLPASLDRDELRSYGLEVGHAVVPDGREEYAEHPYVSGTVEDVDVDVVPCYDVETAADIDSAVDRTPFHTEYVSARLDDDLATEVRLAKAFCTGIGVYGSDLRTRGFSGYLLELLVLEYGGARGLLEAAADWHPPVELDPEDHGTTTFDDPLVVVDPTDPGRNVAAVCTATNVARLQHHARQFLAEPVESVFARPRSNSGRPEDASITADELLGHLDRRATTALALRFDAPDLVEDDLYPQLRTSRRGIVGLLDRSGFDVVRSTVAVNDGDALVFFELGVAERPAIERHDGPPVHVREHATSFYETYADDPDVYGPFVDGDRYVVERPREHPRAINLLESDRLFDVGHGVAIERALEADHEVLVDEDLTALLPAFDVTLGEYFDPRP